MLKRSNLTKKHFKNFVIFIRSFQKTKRDTETNQKKISGEKSILNKGLVIKDMENRDEVPED